MRFRDAVLCYQETQTPNAGTKTIDLDIVDPVSALAFEFEAVNGTTSNINNPLYECVTKIEVVDGADVLAALEAKEIQALQFYKTGKTPTIRCDEGPKKGTIEGFMLLFGRHLWDPEFALDLNKFKNPQLKITWNLSAITAVAEVTSWATGTFKISVIAKIMEDAPRPAKFLMAKTVETWTGGDSGDKRSQLPVDYPYHLLLLSSYLSGNDVRENITKLKFTCDTDKFIPLERYTRQFNEEMAQQFGRCIFWKKAYVSDDEDIWLPVNQEPHVQIIKFGNALLAGYDVLLNSCWSGVANVNVVDASEGAYATDQTLDLLIHGHAIHSTIPIPFGLMDNPATWFNPTAYRKIELVMTEAAAADNRIAIEQVRPL